MKKQDILNIIGQKLAIPETLWELGPGATEHKPYVAELAVRVYAILPEETSGLTKISIMEKTFAKLGIKRQNAHFSKGDTITKKAFADVLSAIETKYK
jgi:hypothetical protein